MVAPHSTPGGLDGPRPNAIIGRFRVLVLGLDLVALCSCGGNSLEITPARGSSFGHFEVRARGAIGGLGDPLTVTVGGIAAYSVVRDGADAVKFVVQGSPSPGRAEVVLSGPGGSLGGAALEYAPPADPRLARLVAFGASLTQGIQSGGLSMHSQLHGPASTLARAAGAYLSLPLIKAFGSLLLEDFDKATCALKPGTNMTQVIATRFLKETLPLATAPGGDLEIARLRVDAAVEVRNIAIGGMKVAQVLEGAKNFTMTLLEHLTWNVHASADALLSEPKETMMDRVLALKPTLIVSTDLIINDYNNVDISKDGIPDTSVLTPPDVMAANLEKLFGRLDATGAEIFLANGPDNTVIAYYQDKVAQLRANGYPEAQATGWAETIQQHMEQYNQALTQSAARRPRIHLVDFRATAAKVFKDGIDVGGQHLTSRSMGGLLSLDGMHFTDTGYALLAQEFIRSINTTLGTRIPDIDLSEVLSQDPLSVTNLRAAGFACAGK